MIDAIERPAHLDAATPLQGLLNYHALLAREYREHITESMHYEAGLMHGGTPFDPQKWWKERVENAKCEDGSMLALWRDQMRFHERCVEYLTNGSLVRRGS